MRLETAVLLLGMAVVTFLPRFIPMALLSRWSPGERLKAGLSYVPVAILAAIVSPAIFSTPEKVIALEPRLLIAAVPVIVLSYFFRRLWLAVVAGMFTFWLMGILHVI